MLAQRGPDREGEVLVEKNLAYGRVLEGCVFLHARHPCILTGAETVVP